MSGPWTYLRHYRRLVVLGMVALLLTSGFALVIPRLLELAVEALRKGDPYAAGRLAGWIAALAVLQCVARIGSRRFLFDAARQAEFDLKNDIFTHLLRLSPSFYRRMPTGEVLSRLTVDAPTLRAMWGPGLLNVVNTVLLIACAVALMLRMSPWLTMWALLPYPALVFFARGFGRRFFALSRHVQDQMGKLSSSVQEDLAGIGVVKAYTLEGVRHGRFQRLSDEYLGKSLALVRARGQMMPLFGALGSVGAVITLFVGGGMVATHQLTLGQLVAFQAYLALLTWPTMAIGWLLSMFQRGMASWGRIQALLIEKPTVADVPGAIELVGEKVRGELELRGLTLEIEGRKILDDVSLRVPAGALVAFVGRTGSGKSTLVEAVPRFVEVPTGSVFLDGIDVHQLSLASLRRTIAYAPQDPFLFSETIAANILFGRNTDGDGDEAGEERAVALRWARVAGLAPDLNAFPEGLDTIVGERGITLSGGQRQRVALARALSAEAKILILDDSLSSVDAQTERDILTELAKSRGNRTVLLVSHRVAAVSAADRIVVLDGGRIVESGTHSELVARGGVYASLYREQLFDGALVEAAS